MAQILKIYPAVIALLLLTHCKSEKKPEMEPAATTENQSFYVGTYTDTESKGIYKYSLETNGTIKQIGLAAVSENPSFLAKSNDNKYIVAVNEVDKDGVGYLESFSIEKDSLLLISKASSGGANPCFVALNDNGYVLVANYTGGNIGLLHLSDLGKLSTLLDVQQHEGQGTTDRQKEPHAHSSWFAKDESTKVIAVDLGTNELWFSKIDTTLNKLVYAEPKKLAMAPGAGPRHLDFHPNKKYVYVLNELDNTIAVLNTLENGSYQIIQTISTLPDGFSDFSKAADIHISKDGKFIYTSNRGHDSIAVFSVDSTNGTIKWVGFESTKGKNPRNFALSPKQDYIVVANQDSDNLVSFQRNAETGLLTFISETKVPKPVCVLF